MGAVRVGDTVYIIENNRYVRACKVLRVTGDFCTIAISHDGAIRVRISRLYPTDEEAKAHLPVRTSENLTDRHYNPWR